MDRFPRRDEDFTYKTAEDLRERDPKLNKFIFDTVVYSFTGAIAGLAVGAFFRCPLKTSAFFAGIGAHLAYANGQVEVKSLDFSCEGK